MMKVTCNHCGASNALGRIFCMACGKRMTITAEDVSQAQARSRAFRWTQMLRPLFILAVFGVAGLIAWPQLPQEQDGTAAERAAMRVKVGAKVSALAAAARSKNEAKESFDSAEMALYMRARVTALPDRAKGSKPLFVRLEGDRMIVIEQAEVGPFKVGGKDVGPLRFSRRVTCRAEGRIFKVEEAAVGRLPLPGPLKSLVSAPLADAFALSPAEQIIEAQVRGFAIRDGKLEINVGP